MHRCAVIIAVFAFAGVTRAQDDPLKQSLALEASIQKVVENAEQAVACILVSRSEEYYRAPYNHKRPPASRPGELGEFSYPFDPMQRTEIQKRIDLANIEAVPDSYGTGVVVGPGLILTNQHVIRDATKIFIRLPNGSFSYANIKTSDERSDLAVLEMIHPPATLKSLPMGDGAAVKKGQFVIAIANPWAAGFKDGSPSVSWGMLSNVRRRLPGEPNEGEKRRPKMQYYPILLQTNLNVPPGSSGGALLDLKGNWIGLLTALPGVAGGEGSGGYAIPLDTRMKRIIDKLKRGEEVEYGFLGIVQGRGDDWRPTDGGPAYKAGMRRGDRIIAINDEPTNDNEDLLFQITTALAGTQIRLTVARLDGRREELRPILAKTGWLNANPIIAANRPEPVHGLRVDYATVAYPGLTPFGGIREGSIPQGVVVRDVEEGSPAAKARLRPDIEIITSVNGRPVDSPKDFYRLAREARGAIELSVIDEPNGQPRKVKLP